MSKSTEDRIHTALTHAVAALDLLERGPVNHTAALAVSAAVMELESCWGACEDCGDRLWKETLTWNPDAGVPDLRTGGYTGKVQCQPCHRRWENRAEPSQADIGDLAEDHAARLAAADRRLRDAGRAE